MVAAGACGSTCAGAHLGQKKRRTKGLVGGCIVWYGVVVCKRKWKLFVKALAGGVEWSGGSEWCGVVWWGEVWCGVEWWSGGCFERGLEQDVVPTSSVEVK